MYERSSKNLLYGVHFSVSLKLFELLSRILLSSSKMLTQCVDSISCSSSFFLYISQACLFLFQLSTLLLCYDPLFFKHKITLFLSPFHSFPLNYRVLKIPCAKLLLPPERESSTKPIVISGGGLHRRHFPS